MPPGGGDEQAHHRQLDFPAPRDDSTCTILHVDMDAFYASVELLSRPMLRGKPVIVGGSGSAGVVLSATYEAREFGVRCHVHGAGPQVVPGRAGDLAGPPALLQSECRSHGIFSSITPNVEPCPWMRRSWTSVAPCVNTAAPLQVAETLRARVFDEQGITCSVGGAPNKFVAKVASAHAKPDGVLMIPAESVLAFLHPLPVGALWGSGRARRSSCTASVCGPWPTLRIFPPGPAPSAGSGGRRPSGRPGMGP